MQTGALIVAAGKSSRMGDFKPMLQIGSISIAQRVINNFRQAGISKIVVVTGYHADVLERHLASNNVIFLRNENYETTHMFDSVRIGLEYLKDKVDRVLFTPVDVPLFTAQTVMQMIAQDHPLITPVCEDIPGHPILIHSSLIDTIIKDDGKSGLRGAVENCGTPMYYLNVDDPGIVHDADTPEDYAELLRAHNQSLIRSEVHIQLAREKVFFDEQFYSLLTLIRETGSVRDACEHMHISYSTSWNLIHTLESQLHEPLIIRSQGGVNGSHSELTPYGEEFLKRYARFSEETRNCSKKIFEECFRGFFNG